VVILQYDIKIYCITDTKRYDITDIVENGISWSRSKSEFAFTLDFSIAYRQVEGLPVVPVEVGSVIEVILSDNVAFSGLVLTEKYGIDTEPVSYKAVDFCYYFNQNKEIFHFNKKEASLCIKELFETMSAPVGDLESSGVEIDRLYYNQSLGEIIKEIIELIQESTGNIWQFYYKSGKFHFTKAPKSKYQDGEISPMILTCEYEDETYNIFDMKIGPSFQNSIEGMVNSVKAITVDGESIGSISEKQDETLIEKYGLFQSIIKLSKEETSEADKSVSNLLEDKGKVFKNTSFKTLGEVNAIPWAVIEDSSGIVYEIISSTFTWDNRLMMDLEVEVIE
jgi:hypothetical protein